MFVSVFKSKYLLIIFAYVLQKAPLFNFFGTLFSLRFSEENVLFHAVFNRQRKPLFGVRSLGDSLALLGSASAHGNRDRGSRVRRRVRCASGGGTHERGRSRGKVIVLVVFFPFLAAARQKEAGERQEPEGDFLFHTRPLLEVVFILTEGKKKCFFDAQAN